MNSELVGYGDQRERKGYTWMINCIFMEYFEDQQLGGRQNGILGRSEGGVEVVDRKILEELVDDRNTIEIRII